MYRPNVFDFLPHDARSAKRAIAIVSRLFVRLSVCNFTYRGPIDWVSSKVIMRIISLGSSLLGAPTSAIYSKGDNPSAERLGGVVVRASDL